ncbi:MAG: aldo/keto reductase [Gemmatimonadota bacterium]
MEYTTLGNTGLSVSRLCLGMMSYGDPKWRPWILDQEAARPFVRRAVEGGINFFDTADMYSRGASEEATGKLLKEFTRRDEVVLATKVFFPMSDAPNRKGLSRKHIMDSVHDSLKRLDVEYIDLYQIHRWDYDTPIEETMEALHDVVKAGYVRYIGASSMFAWQFARALHTADLAGSTPFVSMQNHYNLLYREEEREMIPLCQDSGMGVLPWSPLARGYLTRPAAEKETTRRGEVDDYSRKLYSYPEADHIIQAVGKVAEARGVSRAQVALAWLLSKPFVTAPIIGATRMGHLDDALEALNVKLDGGEIEGLEVPYVPRPVLGHQ